MDKFIIRKKKSKHPEAETGSTCSGQFQEERDGEDQPLTKRSRTDVTETTALDQRIPHHIPEKKKIHGENLDCDYMRLYPKKQADDLFQRCEESLEYFMGDLARIKVYGKWHDIPRKQVAHGDTGLTYKYSGVTVPAKPWTPALLEIRDRIQEVTGYKFNFVLINRYADGNNYMGEHRDDEKDLVASSPIASLSLGQHRDFIFRHCEARGAQAKRKVPPVKLELEHGSLLMMNYPTNVYWYHSLPVRKKALNIRVNMTFRDIVIVKK
ncbi:DNA oxidative demethylase ALKBH2 [Strongylocentrotus purpuratus]|uniref:DNA oxidative demethylase ALKBH2 n=1 Tax=Strongylocentrotus purpuratus TaxID=7668 RepID=A0A7M7T1P6_STRPU|nr:DNA oxidative demethylase ALKBH2 [Strongylocentrotus purpuratus]